MPEGPEVKIMCEELNKLIAGEIVTSIFLTGGRYSNSEPSYYSKFIQCLPVKLVEVKCKGKFIWFQFDNHWTMWCSLGLTGGWKTHIDNYSSLEVITEKTTVWFSDKIQYGSIKFCNSGKMMVNKLESLGPDLLDISYSFSDFKQRIRQYNNNEIPTVLMNQSIFCGVGNYLKSEILYASKISPYRKVKDIPDEELELLFKKIREIITLSYQCGGGTLSRYSNLRKPDANGPYKFLVYNRYKDTNGYSVKKEYTSDKRNTFWVPSIQI